jgi:hypothetical protein
VLLLRFVRLLAIAGARQRRCKRFAFFIPRPIRIICHLALSQCEGALLVLIVACNRVCLVVFAPASSYIALLLARSERKRLELVLIVACTRFGAVMLDPASSYIAMLLARSERERLELLGVVACVAADIIYIRLR